MLLADQDIRRFLDNRQLIIKSMAHGMDFDPAKQVGPGSIDLRLSNKIRRFKAGVEVVDFSSPNIEALTVPEELSEDGEIEIKPNEMIQATTVEQVLLPPYLAAFIMGRSSVARLGLMVHVTQEFIQPGSITLVPLQLVNVIDRPIRIKPFLSICQIALIETMSPAAVPYANKEDAKYGRELFGPQPSRVQQDVAPGRAHNDDLNALTPAQRQVIDVTDQLRKEIFQRTGQAEATKGQQDRFAGVLALVYIVLGAGISICIEQLDVQPFPSQRVL
jgi:dCTP deaminase